MARMHPSDERAAEHGSADILVGALLFVAAIVFHNHRHDGGGPAEFLLWTATVALLVRGTALLARFNLLETLRIGPRR
ncbi:MAG TPA: hypothetical protein VFM09_12010 [Marmoricola sp.]|nr:hypothetical protein [Marmoricola sp.]